MTINDLLKCLGKDDSDITTFLHRYQDFHKKISDILIIAQNVIDKIQKAISKLPIEKFLAFLVGNQLVEQYWPPFIDFTEEQNLQIHKILSTHSTDTDNLEINLENFFFKTFDLEKIQNMMMNWESHIDQERFIILKEGIEMYLHGNYISSNVVLISQYGGLIIKNMELLQSNSEKLNNELESLQKEQEEYQQGRKFHDSEKKQLERQFYINRIGVFGLFHEYFYDYVYSSGDISQEVISRVANRNKVLHGEDTSFGTKVKALKTILCIDMLIQLPQLQITIMEKKTNGKQT